jgi:pSer/pThr/pTyr-binding forkhead associated (FHA) protein
MWILRSSEADGSVTFRLPSGASRTVGRAPRADFVLDAALVSRLHCRITAADERLDIEDLSSTNGTFVNDRRIDKGPIRAGDRLRIGRVELTVERANP